MDKDQRGGDRRTSDAAYAGPERRIAERRSAATSEHVSEDKSDAGKKDLPSAE
jgi:hypothetical protein